MLTSSPPFLYGFFSQVLKKLALDTCRDVLIGSQMAKGISGGQAKRTNIGIALITNPRVIFLDEPTSGVCGGVGGAFSKLCLQFFIDQCQVC